MSLPNGWFKYKSFYNAHDRLQSSKNGARRREKQIARMERDESRGGGGCFGVLVFLLVVCLGLASCARDIVVGRGVVVEKTHVPGTSGTGWVNGHIVVTRTDAVYRLVVRVDGDVVEVPVRSDWYWNVLVGDTIDVHRFVDSRYWKMVPRAEGQ